MTMTNPLPNLLLSVAALMLSTSNGAMTSPASAGPTAPSEFRYAASVEGDFRADEAARVRLPVHVIGRIAYDFSDLRVYDDRGEEVPYVIHKERRPAVNPSRFEFKVLSYEAGENADTIVLEQPDPPRQFNAIEIATSARDFRKTVRVESGYSLDNWTDVHEDAIFDFSSRVNLRRNRVDLPVVDAPFLRLTIQRETKQGTADRKITLEYEGLFFEASGQEDRPFRIDRIEGVHGPSKPEVFSFDRMSLPSPEVTLDEDGNTLIPLGGVNLPVSSIALEVNDTFFHRRVEVWTAREDRDDAYRPRASGDVYRIPGMATPEVTLEGLQVRDPYVTLKVLNADNPPLDITGVELAWVRRILYFFPARGREYTFCFGSENAKRPVYETGKILSAEVVGKEEVQELVAGPVSDYSGFDPALSDSERKRIEKILLSLFVILTIAGLSAWGYSMVKQLPRRSEGP
jgi:hypothetical protein